MKLSNSARDYLSDWSKDVLRKVLLPYQERYVLDRSRYVVVDKSRRVGITWCSALKSVLRRISIDSKRDHIFASIKEDKAWDFIRYARDWADRINTLLGEMYVPVDQWTKDRGIFRNGSQLIGLSSNPNAMRSNEGDVTLDEYAFHEQAHEIYGAAQPCLMWFPDAILEVISSTNGTADDFYAIREGAKNKANRFSYHGVTLEQAVEQGLALKIWKNRIPDFPDKPALDKAFIEDVKSGCLSEDDYLREYCCQPAKSSSLVKPEEYDACAIDPNYLQAPEELADTAYNALYVGIDCGRAKDLTAALVLEQGIDAKAPEHLSDVYRIACLKTMWNTPFPIQESVIRGIVCNPFIEKGKIDPGSVGRGLADSVVDETGSIIEPHAFTAPRKAAMAERVRQFFQQRRILVPKDPKLRADVCCVRKEQQSNGAWKYDGKCNDSHGDRFWALALALEAASQRVSVSISNPMEFPTEPTERLALPA